jgi:hypothetical protein
MEVTKQIGPLAVQISAVKETMRSLCRNGEKGAPGFLETAREIDNGRFDMIFKMLQEFKDDLKPLKKFMDDHQSKEEQRGKDRTQEAMVLAAKVSDSERRFKRYTTLMTVALAALMALIALWDHRSEIFHTLAGDPPAASPAEPIRPPKGDDGPPKGAK